MLLLHILIALTSVVFTTYLYFAPTQTKLNASYGLVGLTVATGTLLIVTTGVPILKTCITGLLYVAAMSVVIVMARRKLAVQKVRNKSED